MHALLCILGAGFQHKGKQNYKFSLGGIAIKQTKSIESQVLRVWEVLHWNTINKTISQSSEEDSFWLISIKFNNNALSTYFGYNILLQ